MQTDAVTPLPPPPSSLLRVEMEREIERESERGGGLHKFTCHHQNGAEKTEELQGGMNTCFNSSDPMAYNATLLYDDDTEEGDLWRRGVQSGPLPTCSASSTPPDSRCLICRDRIVFAVCRNVPRAVKMMMEAAGHQVKISKSECPKLPSDDSSWPVLVSITIILLFLLIGVLLLVYWKWQRGTETQSHTGGESIALTDQIP